MRAITPSIAQLCLTRSLGWRGRATTKSLSAGTCRRLSQLTKASNPSVDIRVFRHQILTSPRIREARTGYFPVEFEGRRYLPTTGEWKTHLAGMRRLIMARRVTSTGATLSYVRYLDDFPAYPLTNVWDDTQFRSGDGEDLCGSDNARVIERCFLMTTDPATSSSIRLVARARPPMSPNNGARVDHHRHEPGCPGSRPHSLDGGKISLLLLADLSADFADKRR